VNQFGESSQKNSVMDESDNKIDMNDIQFEIKEEDVFPVDIE